MLYGGQEGPFHSANHSISHLDIFNLNIFRSKFLLHFVHSCSQTTVFSHSNLRLREEDTRSDGGEKTQSVTKILSTAVSWRYIALEICW